MRESELMLNKESRCDGGRRRFFRILTGYAGAAAVEQCSAAEAASERLLKDGDRIDIGGRGQEIIKKAYDLGYKYEAEMKGCAQWTAEVLLEQFSGYKAG